MAPQLRRAHFGAGYAFGYYARRHAGGDRRGDPRDGPALHARPRALHGQDLPIRGSWRLIAPRHRSVFASSSRERPLLSPGMLATRAVGPSLLVAKASADGPDRHDASHLARVMLLSLSSSQRRGALPRPRNRAASLAFLFGSGRPFVFSSMLRAGRVARPFPGRHALVAIALGAVIRGEVITPIFVAGGVLVAVGVYIGALSAAASPGSRVAPGPTRSAS